MHPVAQKELEENREAIAAICHRYGVVRLSIFGSATGDEFDPQLSDFDFVAEFGEWADQINALDLLVQFPEELASHLGRPVDIVSVRALPRKNEFFRRNVARTMTEVYAPKDRVLSR